MLTGLTALACLRAGRALAGGPAAPSIIVAIPESAPPVAFKDSGGRMTGMIVDGLDTINATLGWNFKFDGFPWARSQEMVRSGEADAHVTIATPARAHYMRFARRPLFTRNSAVIHFSPGNPRAAQIRQIRSLDDLRAFTIAVTLGDSWPKALMEGWPNVMAVKDDGTTFLMVAADRADIVIQSREAARYAKQASNIQVLECIDAPFLSGGLSEFRFGIRSGFPAVDALIDAFDQRQQSLIDSGDLVRVMAKYR
ncbi:MAG TPA: transporter substrate-binding domain-containing protein [Aliidongia sp.]|uniref:substrate-binding periplasmic protein n=1 Tax=Aliidongia sp. TaxID=1914230 RepID=UPI002DDDA78A|nr:transporter substrate-binding domain-containing protein [Aliidongia sp.]HEV2675450.1 transporter substrate-binding domain-containing protein [Aliidongia sp.]